MTRGGAKQGGLATTNFDKHAIKRYDRKAANSQQKLVNKERGFIMNKNEIKNAIENIATTNSTKTVVIPSKLTETASAILDAVKRVDKVARLTTDYKEGSATSYAVLNAPSEGDIQKAMRYEVYIKRTRLIAYIGNLSPLAKVGVNNPHLNGTSHQYAKTKETRLVYESPIEFIEDINKAYPIEESKPKASASKRKTTPKKGAKAV